jgi:uncharacterized protein (TIGR02118 family)
MIRTSPSCPVACYYSSSADRDEERHMIKYIALYQPPADPEAFDQAYFSSHKPLIDKVPGLIRQEIAKVARVFVPGMLGEAQPYLIAELYFESKDAMKAAFASPEWQASGANLTEIGGMELVSMFSAEVVE